MEFSGINWTDHTWNPWIGCRHVSAECDHCYADFLVTKRMGRDFGAVTRTKTWRDPSRWNARAPELQAELGRRVRVFCASLTDFFLQDADSWRDEAWQVIRDCQNLDFLILTKRPRLIPSRLPADWGTGYANVWLGTTCGVRSSYSRIDDLRRVTAAVRFISAEPLLESLHDINLGGNPLAHRGRGVGLRLPRYEGGVGAGTSRPLPRVRRWVPLQAAFCVSSGYQPAAARSQVP